jgi:hypothetical protein
MILEITADEHRNRSRWYGKKIYHMLLQHEELDSMMKHHLSPAVYTHMCEILDGIQAKVSFPHGMRVISIPPRFRVVLGKHRVNQRETTFDEHCRMTDSVPTGTVIGDVDRQISNDDDRLEVYPISSFRHVKSTRPTKPNK